MSYEDEASERDTPSSPPEPTVTIMPIRPFNAFDGSVETLKVVGVAFSEDMPQFLVIEQDDDEIWPRFRAQVLKLKQSAQGAAP